MVYWDDKEVPSSGREGVITEGKLKDYIDGHLTTQTAA